MLTSKPVGTTIAIDKLSLNHEPFAKWDLGAGEPVAAGPYMVPEIIQRRCYECNIGIRQDPDVSHIVAFVEHVMRRPSCALKDVAAEKDGTCVGDRVMQEKVVHAFIMAGINVVRVPSKAVM